MRLRGFLDLLFPPRETELAVRIADEDTLTTLLAPILIPSLPFPTTALFSYHDTLVRSLILEAKFHGNTRAAKLLGSALRETLSARTEESLVLIPIPLSRERRRTRGYNQVEEVARVALLGNERIALEPAHLVRTRDTAPQTGQDASLRRTNMTDAFSAHDISPSHTYIVLDDVTTTGATLQAAVSALVLAGATRVLPLALAH